MQQVTPDESVLADLGTYGTVPRVRSRNAQRLAIEHGVTGVLARSSDLQQAAPLIVRVVCEELGWVCGACWIETPSADGLTCAGAWGEEGAAVKAFLEATPVMRPTGTHEGLVRRAWVSGDPVWIRDVVSEPSF